MNVYEVNKNVYLSESKLRFLLYANLLRKDGGVSIAKGLYIFVGVLPSKHLDRVLGVIGVKGDSSNLKRRLVVGRSFYREKKIKYKNAINKKIKYILFTCVAILKPVLNLFIDLKTELILCLRASLFFATVLTATCQTCELQFLDLGLLLDNE